MADALFNVTLVGDREIVARLERMPGAVRESLRAKLETLTIALQTHIVRDKLHGQVLNQRSGALARSIQRRIDALSSAMYGVVFSAGDVKYAKIHEFGGQTPPHDIYPSKAKALHFTIGGREVFAKVVHHPGSKMPERSFMRSSLADMRGEIREGLLEAVLSGARSR
jgi:phage gpG-like protein